MPRLHSGENLDQIWVGFGLGSGSSQVQIGFGSGLGRVLVEFRLSWVNFVSGLG